MGLFGGGGNSIDVKEAHRRAEAGEVILVDVREQHEWAGGHAPMAKHIPLNTVGTSLADLGKQGKPIAFICQSGGRSGNACKTAGNAGVSALNVKGDMGAWTRAGLPVAR
jgi:rhodanese-related sulfurtransferase